MPCCKYIRGYRAYITKTWINKLSPKIFTMELRAILYPCHSPEPNVWSANEMNKQYQTNPISQETKQEMRIMNCHVLATIHIKICIIQNTLKTFITIIRVSISQKRFSTWTLYSYYSICPFSIGMTIMIPNFLRHIIWNWHI